MTISGTTEHRDDPATDGDDTAYSDADTGEYHSGPLAGTVTISTFAHGNLQAEYASVDGLAIFEGDIVLGTIDEVDGQEGTRGIGITGLGFRWPDATVPFEVDSALPGKQRVTDAVAHWHNNTRIRWVPRTPAHSDYVRFVDGTKTNSPVGRQGGPQVINLLSSAPMGSVVHEMGHSLGLWHEQSREDRNSKIKVHKENITDADEFNFDQHITDGDDIGAYDFGSIMHYSKTAFSSNGKDTIEALVPLPAGVVMGQRNALSAGDVNAIHTLYPDWSGINDRWRNIGGVFPRGAQVDVVARTPNNLDLFICGNDGCVYTSWWTSGNDWSGIADRWRNIGGVFPKGAPVTAVSRTPNILDLFVTGNDGCVYTSWWVAGSDWSGIGNRWRNIGGVFPPGAPIAAVSRTPNNLDLFITGNDGCVYTSWWQAGSDWSGIGNRWRNIGGVFPRGTRLSALARTPNNLDVFVCGNDGCVYTSWWQARSDWSGIGNRWRNIGGVFPAGSAVASVARTKNNLDLFITGNDGCVYTSWWQG
jgi:hypothetical protein